MQCINCGKQLQKNTEICPRCGKNQPDARPARKTGIKTIFASISLIFLVIGLCILPLIIILTAVLSATGIVTDASFVDVISQVVKLSILIAGPPLLISLIFYILGK